MYQRCRNDKLQPVIDHMLNNNTFTLSIRMILLYSSMIAVSYECSQFPEEARFISEAFQSAERGSYCFIKH